MQWLTLASLCLCACVFDPSGLAARHRDGAVADSAGRDSHQVVDGQSPGSEAGDTWQVDGPAADMLLADAPPPDQPAVKTVVPSNVSSPLPPTCGTLTLSSATSIDTTACKVGSCQGQVMTQASSSDKTCVLQLQALSIASGVTVEVQGVNPLTMVVAATVTIDGVLDGGAKGTTPGPGGYAGGVMTAETGGVTGEGPGKGLFCSCSTTSGDDCGGGGGGYGSAGGAGGIEGSCSSTSPGGASYGNASLVPLVGGSGGASGHNLTQDNKNAYPGSGGAGGGAIQISADAIAVDGAITVGGGGGQAPSVPPDATDRGAGGGGSGGAILLEARQITGTGWLAANGGGGGAGSDDTDICTAGQDGQVGDNPATGGPGKSGDCLQGGDGAAGSTSAGSGANPSANYGGGGGGGGGLGRIRLNWCASCAAGYPAPTVKLSGTSSEGEVTLQ